MIRSIINTKSTLYSLSKVTKRLAHLDVTPRVAFFDEPCAITASALPPNSAVTLRAEVTNAKGKISRSHAYYVANADGCLDITETPSLGGSYRGIYPMGLFVGLQSLDEKYRHVRLHKSDPYVPWSVELSIHKGHTEFAETVEPLSTVAVKRHLICPGVKRVPIKQGKVRGMLYLPPGPGPHPGIIDIYGAAGGLLDHRAQLQASRGIASLAVAYFGYDDLPDNIENVDLDMFIEAVNVLTSYPGIIPDRCGVVASSQGGIYGYMLADRCEKVKAVVTVNGNPFPYGTNVVYKNNVITPPLIKLSSNDMKFKDLVGYLKMEHVKECLDPKNKQVIEFGPGSLNKGYLLISGSSCSFGGPMLCDAVMKRLREIGNDDVTHINYEGGSHIIEPPYTAYNTHYYNPYWPYTEGGPVLPKGGIYLGLGGNVESNHAAMEDMWPKILQFFNRRVKTDSLWYQQWLTDSASK